MTSVPHVSNVARPSMIVLVEEHLTGLIREASTVQRHCKRARIHVPSSGSADATKNAAPKRRLHAEDINLALQWRGSEKIYATATVGGNSSDDRKVNIQEYIQSELEMRPPHEVGLTVHWLAVDGVQPDIEQNPEKRKEAGPVHRVEPEEDSENTNADGVQVTQLLPRLLSEELQLYFSRVTTAMERGSATPATREQQDVALASMARDSGLQELVPFFINYVSKALYKHVGNPMHCQTLVRMARSLLQNPHLHLELHLHQLLPALLTMVVAESLSSKLGENHWILRNEAAMALVEACDLFGEDYATLKARVLRTLCDAAGPDKCLPTQYGGIVAISLFGSKAINAFILPLALEYWKVWEKTLDITSDLQQREELQMCQQAVLTAVGVFLSEPSMELPSNAQIRWEDLEDTFGDHLVALGTQEMDYSFCFI